MLRNLVIGAAIAVAAIATAWPSAADLQVKLNDGRVFTLPISPDQVESFSFTPGPGHDGRTHNATGPAQGPSSRNSLPPGPVVVPATSNEKLLPTSGRILRVGPRRQL